MTFQGIRPAKSSRCVHHPLTLVQVEDNQLQVKRIARHPNSMKLPVVAKEEWEDSEGGKHRKRR